MKRWGYQTRQENKSEDEIRLDGKPDSKICMVGCDAMPGLMKQRAETCVYIGVDRCFQRLDRKLNT